MVVWFIKWFCGSINGSVIQRMVLWCNEWFYGSMNVCVVRWIVVWFNEWFCGSMNVILVQWMVLWFNEWFCSSMNGYAAVNALLQQILLYHYQSRCNHPYPKVSVLQDTTQSGTPVSSIIFLSQYQSEYDSFCILGICPTRYNSI